MLNTVLQFQIDRIKNNLSVFLCLVVTALLVLYVAFRHHAMPQGVAYMAVLWLCSFFIDLYAIKQPDTFEFEVRQPKRESQYVILCVCLGLVFLVIRNADIVDWQHLRGFVKLAIMPLVAFVFPIGLAIILLLLKYKPRDLGFRLKGLILIIPILALFITTIYFIAPQRLTFNAVIEESGGILGALYSGFIMAGLSEEFFRVVGQTRFAAWTKSKGLGWFITSCIWAFMHAPKWYSDGHDLTEALLGSIRIIPLGLMWGYLTHRTKSILPSVIVHGLNVWGLQNF